MTTGARHAIETETANVWSSPRPGAAGRVVFAGLRRGAGGGVGLVGGGAFLVTAGGGVCAVAVLLGVAVVGGLHRVVVPAAGVGGPLARVVVAERHHEQDR